MPKQKNKEIVKNLKEKLKEAESVIFAEYTGLDANSMNSLRKEIRSEGGEITITRNTLMGLALKEEKLNGAITDELKGQIMTLLSFEDAVTPLKRLVEFAEEHEAPKVKIGLFEGNILSKEKILELSKLPSKEDLLTRAVIGLKSPLSGFTNVLGGAQRNFVYALSAIAEEKDK